MGSDCSWGRLIRKGDFNPGIVAEKLTAHCSSLRPNSRCTLSTKAASDSEHVIKEINFEDGMKWVARLYCPVDEQHGRFASNRETRVSSEVAAHRLIRQKTDIPVPEVYSYDASNETIGWPFVLMECMLGKPAIKRLANATPEQDSHFLRQMAQIQVKLANVRMDRIGSIFQSSDGFEVGPDVETAQGPFKKPKQYYQAVASHRDKRSTAYGFFETETLNRGDLPALFSLCTNSVVDDYTEDTFGLANRDLGPHNLLIDDDFNVKAMIDLDFVLSAPLHVVASLPHRSYTELDPVSSDLGGRKRVEEYLNALDADRPDFRNIIRSPLANIWAELERLDHAFGVEESVRIEVVRSAIRFVIQDESFVGGGNEVL
ncbi:hypothetical protein OEA41_008683 [Lepraria neglecta]|uniref:Aminoglycoside phosphotransferase domain-containing protein n=1 Tax=Lepraria neglecta TaxID=209136 RepID=A0AAE0DHD6_9LECA|nr:hypothetical protein OEA41_008683 [Lepraria neglecta]